MDFYVKMLKILFKLLVFYFNGNKYYLINNELSQHYWSINNFYYFGNIPKLYQFLLNKDEA